MSDRMPTEALRIAEDWTVGDIQSVNDCDEALILLTRDIQNIDIQIAEHDDAVAAGAAIESEWLARARGARAVKNAIRGILQRKQAEFSRADKSIARETWRGRLIDNFRLQFPEQYAVVLRQQRNAGGAE